MKLWKLNRNVIAQASLILGMGVLTVCGQGCGQMKSESGADMSSRRPLEAPPASVGDDTTAPMVSVSAPAANSTISGTVSITATASDDAAVVGVQFMVDGANLGAEDMSAPFSASFNTATFSNGSHIITVRARDAAGNSKVSAPIAVTVNNSTPSSTFPDQTNTGVPAGVTLKNTSGRTISVAGTVVDSENISGTLVIAANNVTVKRSRITSGGYYVIEVKNGVTGFVLEDSEINGVNSEVTTGIRTASARISRCNIYGSVDGILITGSNTIIEDNYIHDMYAPEGAHVDPITNDGEGDNTIVRHNHIYLPSPDHTTAVMTFDAYWAPIKGIRIENNLLRGGTYVLRIENSSHGVSDAHILNNAFQKIGSAGYGIINTGEVSGNYDYVSNKNIDNQL